MTVVAGVTASPPAHRARRSSRGTAPELAHEGVREIEAVVAMWFASSRCCSHSPAIHATAPSAALDKRRSSERVLRLSAFGKEVRPAAPQSRSLPQSPSKLATMSDSAQAGSTAARRPQGGMSKVERGAVGALRILPGPVRQRREAVVDRERIVAVVEIGVQQREVRAPAVLRFEPELEPRRRLVAAVRVVTPEEPVLAEPVAHRALEHGTPGATGGVTGGQCPTRGGAPGERGRRARRQQSGGRAG